MGERVGKNSPFWKKEKGIIRNRKYGKIRKYGQLSAVGRSVQRQKGRERSTSGKGRKSDGETDEKQQNGRKKITIVG